jgi:hypothetical protein
MSLQNSNDAFGNLTLDLPACRAVPEPNIKNFITLSDFGFVEIYIGNNCTLVSHKRQYSKHAHIYLVPQH